MSDIEAYVPDNPDAFIRNTVEVVAFRRIPEGALVRSVDPSSVERTYFAPDRPSTRVTWQVSERLIPTDSSSLLPDDLEHSAVVCRVHRSIARDVGLALIRWADGDKAGPPGDAAALRRDLEREKDRVDRLMVALVDLGTIGQQALADALRAR